MPSFRPARIAAAIALAVSASGASAQFTNTYVFGDSLSDAGQYGGARFTTNPGLVTPMFVGQYYGLTVTPSFTGGLGYAQGGARVNSPSSAVPPQFPDYSIAQQVNLQLSKTPVLDPGALYQIQGGANDIFQLGQQFLGGQISQAQLQAGVTQAALDLAAQVVKLRAAGAQYIILQALPDMGKTPDAIAGGPLAQQLFTQLSQTVFNATLNSAIAASGVQVIQFNTAALFNEIIASPSLYGFVNVVSRACTTGSSLNCTPSTLVAPNANMNYLFADGVHPTTGADMLFTQAIISMITGPQQMAALGQAPMDVERANWRTLDSRMASGIGTPGSSGKFQAWAAYDYSSADLTGTSLSGSGDLNTVSVGGDMRVTDKLLAGIQFGYTEYKGDFGNGGGDFKLREPMMTFYAGYGEGPWYVGATLGAGYLDYSTDRTIALGATTRTESGDTTGYHTVGRLLGGYWFRYCRLESRAVRQADVGEDRRPPVQREGQRQHLAYVQPAGLRFDAVERGLAGDGRHPGLPALRARHVGVQLRRRYAPDHGQVQHARGHVHRAGIHAGRQLVADRRRRQQGLRQRHRIPVRQRVGQQGRRQLLGDHARHRVPL